MLVKSCPQRRPAANINETNAAAPFRRAFYAVSGSQERPTRFYRSAAKTDEQRCANRYGFTSISKPAVLSPTDQLRTSRAPPRHFAAPSMPFRRRSRLYSNAAPPKQQRKKPDGNRFADSARQCRRSKSGRAAIPRRPRRTTAQKKTGQAPLSDPALNFCGSPCVHRAPQATAAFARFREAAIPKPPNTAAWPLCFFAAPRRRARRDKSF